MSKLIKPNLFDFPSLPIISGLSKQGAVGTRQPVPDSYRDGSQRPFILGQIAITVRYFYCCFRSAADQLMGIRRPPATLKRATFPTAIIFNLPPFVLRTPPVLHLTKVFAFLILLVSTFPLYGQTRQELENRRKKLLSDIKVTSKVLKETTKNKAAALDEYNTLQAQINQRKELVQTIQSEIGLAQQRMDRDEAVIDAMESDIVQLKEEYATLLQHAFRQKLNQSNLWFLLSADSFNQALQRWRYIKQYERYRSQQSTLIVETKDILSNKRSEVATQKQEKEGLLQEQQAQQKKLAGELERRNEILRSLRRDEKRLRTNLKKQRFAHEQLNQAIEAAINATIASQRRESRSSDALKPKPSLGNTATLTTDFQRNKRNIIWPVESGVITRWFGEQQHPSLPKVKIQNNGIDIRTEKNAIVRAVFEGVVASKQFVPGNNNMLIIRHGDYYTVYGNLDVVFVEKGDRINGKQHIGKVSVDPDSGISEVHFEVWRSKVRLNPTDWLKK